MVWFWTRPLLQKRWDSTSQNAWIFINYRVIVEIDFTISTHCCKKILSTLDSHICVAPDGAVISQAMHPG